MYLPRSCTSHGSTSVSPNTTLNVCPLDVNFGWGVTPLSTSFINKSAKDKQHDDLKLSYQLLVLLN